MFQRLHAQYGNGKKQKAENPFELLTSGGSSPKLLSYPAKSHFCMVVGAFENKASTNLHYKWILFPFTDKSHCTCTSRPRRNKILPRQHLTKKTLIDTNNLGTHRTNLKQFPSKIHIAYKSRIHPTYTATLMNDHKSFGEFVYTWTRMEIRKQQLHKIEVQSIIYQYT